MVGPLVGIGDLGWLYIFTLRRRTSKVGIGEESLSKRREGGLDGSGWIA